MNVLSAVTLPLHRCHLCEWIGNPDSPQRCPECDSQNVLSLLLSTKFYESQLTYPERG